MASHTTISTIDKLITRLEKSPSIEQKSEHSQTDSETKPEISGGDEPSTDILKAKWSKKIVNTIQSEFTVLHWLYGNLDAMLYIPEVAVLRIGIYGRGRCRTLHIKPVWKRQGLTNLNDLVNNHCRAHGFPLD